MAMDGGECVREALDQLRNSPKRAQKLRSQAPRLGIVPLSCVQEIGGRLGAKAELHSTRLVKPLSHLFGAQVLRRRLCQPTVEFLPMPRRYRHRIGFCRDAVPNVLDQSESLFDREPQDLLD